MHTTPALHMLPFLAFFAACRAGGAALEVSPSQMVEAEERIGFEAISSGGRAPHPAVVRSLNRFGAAVPSPLTEEITVDGLPRPLQFDGYGYATLSFEIPGISVIGGAVDPVEIIVVDPAWPAPLMQHAWRSPLAPGQHATFGAAIHTGMVLAEGGEVWWAGDGAAPHRVLSQGDEILSLRTGNIDLDGVSDALFWTKDTVFMLKGRLGGGLGWGGAIEAPGYSVASADMGDLSGDNLPDISIAWVDPSGDGIFDVLEGDGLFRFTPAVPRDIPGIPTSIVIGDQTGEGLAQATILLSDGAWARFIRGAEREYIPIGPRAPVDTMILPEGSELLHGGDVNGDGAGEISIGGPRAEGQPRSLWFVDIATDALACVEDPENADIQCATEFLPLENEPGAWAALADANGDFYDDIFLAEDNRVLYAVALDPLEIQGRYGKVRVLELPSYGPIDLLDTDRDGGMDLLHAGDSVIWRWRGIGYDDGDLERFWSPVPVIADPVRDLLVPPFLLAELGGGASTIEAVVFSIEDGVTLLRVVQHTPGEQRALLLDQVEIDDQGRHPDDIALCGSDLYFVIGGEVGRIALTDPTNLPAPSREGSNATRVACSEVINASIAVLEGGDVQMRGRVSLAPTEALIPANAFDVAMGDIGAGTEVATCETEGCSIVWWPYGDDGAAGFAWGDSLGITLRDSDGVERPIGGAGQLTVADIDRDGHLDLIGLDGSGLEEKSNALVSIHRSTGATLVPIELYHADIGWSRSIGVADGDGDGQNDLFGINTIGDLLFVRSAAESTGR